MKSLIVVLLATSAAAFATAATALPFNYNGAFLASFTAPSGPFTHCIALTDTEQYQDQGYTFSGTWTDTDFPDTGGTWVVYNNVIHIAGGVDGSAYLTIDGHVGQDKLRENATFDYFDPSGNYFAAGSVGMVADASCASPSVKKPAVDGRSFLK
jgi:hypothetical protein